VIFDDAMLGAELLDGNRFVTRPEKRERKKTWPFVADPGISDNGGLECDGRTIHFSARCLLRNHDLIHFNY